jgi:hypothetical protein
MMPAVRFAKRIGPVRDRSLDANGVGARSISTVQSTFAQLGRARVHLDTPRAGTEAFRGRRLIS